MRVTQFDISRVTKVGGMGSPYQTARAATPDTFGAAAGQQTERQGVRLEQDSDKLMRVAIDIRQKDNETEAKKLDAEAMRRVRIESYGGQLDPNDPASQKTGYYNSKNDETIAATGNFQGAIKKHYDDVLAMASNDSVKRMLSKSFASGYNTHYNNSAKYHIRQRNNVAKMAGAARQQEAQQAAILAITPEEYAKKLSIVTSEVAQTLRSQGFTDPAFIASQIQDAQSEAAIARIKFLQSQDKSEQAEAFAKSEIAAGRLDERKAGETLSLLKKSVARTEAYRTLDNITGPGNKFLMKDGFLDAKKVATAREKLKNLPASVRKVASTEFDAIERRINSQQKIAVGEAYSKIATMIRKEGKTLNQALQENPDLERRIAATGPRGMLDGLSKLALATEKGQRYAGVTTKAGKTVLVSSDRDFVNAKVEEGLVTTAAGVPHVSTDYSEGDWGKLLQKVETANDQFGRTQTSRKPYNDAMAIMKEMAPRRVRQGMALTASQAKKDAFEEAFRPIKDYITNYRKVKKEDPTYEMLEKFIRTQFIKAGIDTTWYKFGGTVGDINQRRGFLTRYPRFSESEKDFVEIGDYKNFRSLNSDVASAIDRSVQQAQDNGQFSAIGQKYITAYGIDRFKNHIAAMKLVGDNARITRLFKSGGGNQ